MCMPVAKKEKGDVVDITRMLMLQPSHKEIELTPHMQHQREETTEKMSLIANT